MSIDHINGGGSQHRKSIGKGSGTSFYLWLLQNNFPPGFRVLCMNCQFRARNGTLEQYQSQLREEQEALIALASVC